MTWAKLDDGFFRNRKARLAGKDGRALFLAGLCFCSGTLNDGHILTVDLPLIAAEAEVRPTVAKKLVEVGLWLEVGDGWLVKDYDQYNRRGDDVRREREEGRKRAAESAQRRRGASGEEHREASGEETPKKPRGFDTSSPDQSSSSSSPLVVTSVDSSSSTSCGGGEEDEDWPTVIAKRRLQRRQAERGPVTNPPQWLRETASRVAVDYAEQAAKAQASGPIAGRDLADLLEPVAGKRSLQDRLSGLAGGAA